MVAFLFVFIWHLTMHPVAEVYSFVCSKLFHLTWGCCTFWSSGPVCLQKLPVLAGETLLNQEGQVFISLWCTSSCVYPQVSFTHIRALCFIYTTLPGMCLEWSRYHAQLKVAAIFHRKVCKFLRIHSFGCSLLVRYLLDVIHSVLCHWIGFRCRVSFFHFKTNVKSVYIGQLYEYAVPAIHVGKRNIRQNW